MPFLEIEDLRVTFRVESGAWRRQWLRAVDGVSFGVGRGESVGLVGESGSGKSTLGLAVLGLIPSAGGAVRFEGAEVGTFQGAALRRFRSNVQMVFQDPFGSLNPRLTVGSAIGEVLAIHKPAPKPERRAYMADLMKAVGLDPDYLARYPHEFSGGQRQRVGIARALAVNPTLVIADEPVSALDVSVQVQILNLMKDLQKERGLAYLFIAHDLAVVRYVCSRVLVMYLGRIVESGPTQALFARPAHPYTEALLSAVPDVEGGLRARRTGTSRIVLKGDVPSPTARISGCPFHPRCPRAAEQCRSVVPPAVQLGDGRCSVCHFAGQFGRDT